ncbi:MAG: Trm112 family protein [Altererythrobacter sp.]|nr:Trm112 family protein [Altererythrobacter sp.]
MAGAPQKKKTTKAVKSDDAVPLDPKMLQLLVCPLTKQSLELDAKRCELKSVSARLAYPIRGGIPILLPSEARALTDKEL